MKRLKQYALAAFLLVAAFLMAQKTYPVMVLAQDDDPATNPAFEGPAPELAGFVIDRQGQPVVVADVRVFVDGSDEPVAEDETGEDGAFVIDLPLLPEESVRVEIERAHYAPFERELTADEVAQLIDTRAIGFNTIELENVTSPGFWIAGIAFVLTLVLIALERLQNAMAALTGISIVFIATFVLGAFDHNFFVLDFERAISYINWEVIFLVMGMMIVVGIVENTGIFQWLAFQAYRASRGRISLLIVVLIVITSIASALLDNVTTMLLMVPISLQIALALNINPLAFLIPEILASNVSGISTLIGTPTNIIIGAFADIGFNEFLINQTPGVLAAMVVMTGYVLFYYRQQIRAAGGSISEALYNKLKENAAIEDQMALRKSLLVFGGMLVFFFIGESIHLVPAVTALVGATVLLLVVDPDIEQMLRVVDWTTLVFFMALFMLVGAVQEVGLLSMFAGVMGQVIGDNLVVGILAMVFGVGLLSLVIANVPLTAAMLPVVRFLSMSIPGAEESKALYFALSMGAAMGGNGFIISGETNLMTSGIAERAGYKIGFVEFMKIGVPVTCLTLATGAAWLYFRFVLMG